MSALVGRASNDSGLTSAQGTLNSDIQGILDQYYFGMPLGWKVLGEFLPKIHTLSQSLVANDAKHECVNRIREVITLQRDELLREMGTSILGYLERFRVRSDTADPFKLAYWFGLALSEKMAEINVLDSRVVLLVTVEMLDLFCYTHCKIRMPSEMKSKINVSISEGKHAEEFGLYGIYHSFKSLTKLTKT
jgi:hypothetical protein